VSEQDLVEREDVPAGSDGFGRPSGFRCRAKADGTWHARTTALGKCHERGVPTCGVLREVVLRYAQFGARSVGQRESGERRAVPTRAHMGMEDIGPVGFDDRIDDPWLIV